MTGKRGRVLAPLYLLVWAAGCGASNSSVSGPARSGGEEAPLRVPEDASRWLASAPRAMDRCAREAELTALAWALNEPTWIGEHGEGDGAAALRRKWGEVAQCARRAAGAGSERLARFAEAMAGGLHAVSSVSLRKGLAAALLGGGRLRVAAQLAHLALARAVLPRVLEAVRASRVALAARLLVEGLGVDCPEAMSEALRTRDPAERAERLAAARCLPLCPRAVDALAMASPTEAPPLQPERCPPDSMGLRSRFDRDTAFMNVGAWASMRALEALQQHVEALRDEPDETARVAVERGLTGGLRAALERLRLPVSPPPGIPLGRGRILRLAHEVSHREEVERFLPPTLYVLFDGTHAWVGGAPRARGWARSTRLEGSAWPGRPLGSSGAASALGAARAEVAPGPESVWLLPDVRCGQGCIEGALGRLRALGLERVSVGLWDPVRGRVVPAVGASSMLGAGRGHSPAEGDEPAGRPTGSGGP